MVIDLTRVAEYRREPTVRERFGHLVRRNRRPVLAQRLSAQSHCIRGHDIRPVLDNGVTNPNVFYRDPLRRYGRQCWACSRGRARINQRVRYWMDKFVKHQQGCALCSHLRWRDCETGSVLRATLNHHSDRLSEWRSQGRQREAVAA